MKIERAINLGFQKCEDGFWRKPIKQKGKDGVYRDTWQKYISYTCKKCGENFLASHSMGRYCSRKCFMTGNTFTLGISYKRKNRPDRIIQHGYYWIISEGHPNAIKDRIPEHRAVMEKHIGRILKSTECIHHIDGNRLNNSLNNLVIVSRSEHNTLHKSEEVKHRTRDENGQFL